MTDPRPIAFYSCYNDAEQLDHKDIASAVTEFIDNQDWRAKNVPESVTVFGYARMKASLDADHILEFTLEQLGEEYSDPDGGDIEPTSAMKGASQTFVAAILANYECWACEQVLEMKVKVVDYMTP